MFVKMTPLKRSDESKTHLPIVTMEPVPKVWSRVRTRWRERHQHQPTCCQSLQGSHQLVNPWTSASFPVHVETDVLTVDAEGAQRTAARVKTANDGMPFSMLVCANHDVPRLEQLAQDVFTCEFQITMVVKSTTVYWTVKAIAVVGWTLRCGSPMTFPSRSRFPPMPERTFATKPTTPR